MRRTPMLVATRQQRATKRLRAPTEHLEHDGGAGAARAKAKATVAVAAGARAKARGVGADREAGVCSTTSLGHVSRAWDSLSVPSHLVVRIFASSFSLLLYLAVFARA